MKIKGINIPIINCGAKVFDDKSYSFINESLITIINDNKIIEDIFENNFICKTLKDLNIVKGKVVINLLNEIKKIYYNKDIYILEEIFLELFNKRNEKFYKIDSLNIDYKIYEESIKIVANKLLKNIYIEDILILDLKINEEYCIIKNEKRLLNKVEINIVKNINKHINNIKCLICKYMPGVVVEKIKEEIYITDIEKRDVFISQNVKKEIQDIVESFKSIKRQFEKEKIHTSNLNIRYYFKKALFSNKDKMIIVFSAFSNDKPKYNYINILNTYDCNKLYILDDYGSKGTYYWGLNGGFEIETSVMSLISKIANENNINFKNIISIGSSKGGTAALYYGMKYNFGNIIVGAPQYKVGTYLSDLSIKKYGEEIFGEISYANRIKYDNLIRLVCNNKSKVFLLTSEGDKQYDRVLKSFEYISKEIGINLNLNKCEVTHHNDIAKEFPKYIDEKLPCLLKENKFKRKIIKNIINIIEKNS